MDTREKPVKKRQLAAWHWGAGAAVILVILAVGGWWHERGTVIELAFTLIFSLMVGGLIIGLVFRRLWYLLTGLAAGSLIGIGSALELYFEEPFTQEFFVAEATLTFFVILGLGLGLLVEFVSLLHFLMHGGRVWDYGQPVASGPTAASAPPALSRGEGPAAKR